MRRPNIILFFTDQQRHDTTGIHGCQLGLTPNFDWLAGSGTHVARSFTCQPVCAPARACLQTGYYATQTGTWRNGIVPDPKLPTLAHFFNDAGYATAYIGKWHLGLAGRHGSVPPEARGGYQTFLGANALEFVSDAYDCRVYDNDGKEHRLPGYRVDALTDAAIRYISEPREEAYFLFLSFLEPHHQNHLDNYPAPCGYEAQFAHSRPPPDLAALGGSAAQHWPGYCGMVKRLDEALGRLIDALRSRGELENTVILFTSDHGCHFKTRNNEYKRSCHDASIRVPTAFHGGPFSGGGRIDQLVSLVDLPPTLLDCAGIEVPGTLPGRSILPLLRGGSPSHRWPEEVFVQISESQTGRAIRTSRWKYSVRSPAVDEEGAPISAAAADSYADDLLYDLHADPWELDNLVGISSYQPIIADLRARLVRKMLEAGEAEPLFIDAPARAPGQRRVNVHDGGY